MNNSSRFWLALGRRRSHLVSLQRYIIVGLIQNGLFYLAVLLLLWCGLRAWQATIILYPTAVLISFLINRRWSFADRQMTPGQLRRYSVVYLTAYFSAIGLNWIQETLGVPSWLASLLTMAIAVGLIFVALNFWVFRKQENKR